MDQFQQALQFRHATKKFNDKKISPADLNYILDAGRLAPSSFGLEQWKFLVIQNDETKQALLPLCFNQEQVSTCSDLVLVLGRLDIRPDSAYTAKLLERFKTNAEMMKKIIVPFLERMDEASFKSWVHRQCFLAAQNMMMAAAYKGIDSCPMEGFLADKIAQYLKLDNDIFISLVLPFGYRAQEPKRAKLRWDLEDLVSYIQ